LSILEGFLYRFSREELDLMAVLACRIWLERNTLIFDGVFTFPITVFSNAAEALHEFKMCH
jgi:hypothetical protein